MYDSPFCPADGDLVLRDDQADFPAVLDEVGNRRKRGARLRLIDSGAFPLLEMERLELAGTELYTSDRAGRTPDDLFILNKAARKGGGFIAFFHHGRLETDPASVFPMSALGEAARSGVALYLSNQSLAREASDLAALAGEARVGGTRLGYYHHGPLEAGLSEPARRGAWIHVVFSSGEESENVFGLCALAATAVSAGGGLIVHVETPPSEATGEDLLAAGAYLLFRLPPSDYRSPLRPIEKRAARRRPDPRSSYLYSEFMR